MPKKPTVSLRKPPPPSQAIVEAADSFVKGRPATDGQPSTANGRPRKRGTVQRAGGALLRRVTVYLPPNVANDLSRYCFENDLTMSDVAAQGVIHHVQKLLK